MDIIAGLIAGPYYFINLSNAVYWPHPSVKFILPAYLRLKCGIWIGRSMKWDDKWKRQKIERIAMLLLGALTARNKVGLKLNVSENKIDEVVEILPCLKQPTVSHLRNSDWLAVEVVVDEEIVREIIPKLKNAGATDIIEYPLNKVIP
jgi:ATP phosphoribosyltransferase